MPCLQAAEAGSTAAAALLVQRKAKVDALDAQRCTPLMAACQHGAWEVSESKGMRTCNVAHTHTHTHTHTTHARTHSHAQTHNSVEHAWVTSNRRHVQT
jgi:ABC-type Zn2+ transport system substrate-binding protein/surface adhesin